jgi:hypothetical protein
VSGAAGRGVPACAYRVEVDAAGRVDVVPVVERVEVEVHDGALVGTDVRVTTRAVLVEVADDGTLHGRATEPIALRDGALCFDPSRGGFRTRENRRACGAFNHLVEEADRFGMVNAFVHTRRALDRLGALLGDLGAPRLPPLHVVVGAHSGSRLPGFACGDGDRRDGTLRPLSGGHYRVSRRTTGVPEPEAVDPCGEVHLGPSRYRKPYAGAQAYLRNAAHNPAIVYHEIGHHLCRHTADFRLNAERRPERQRNGKTGIEEGIADYVAAVLLGSGRPYGWYRADRGRRRDLEMRRHASTHGAEASAHAGGATGAAAWWRCRGEIVGNGGFASPADHDRVLLEALVAVGSVAGGGKRRTRGERARVRGAPETMIAAYLDAVTARGGAGARDVAADVLDGHGLLAAEASVGSATC